jgi:lactoylglutathione lyase
MELIHTCYRIGDIDRSVAFYEALGFEERRRMPIRDEAINVFMGLPGRRRPARADLQPRRRPLRAGHGLQPCRGDGLRPRRHARALAEKGIEPEKPPYQVRAGGSRICFVRDPDGYRIELIERGA